MYCMNCGNQNEDTTKFCVSCGNPLISVQPQQMQYTQQYQQPQQYVPYQQQYIQYQQQYDPYNQYQQPQQIQKRQNIFTQTAEWILQPTPKKQKLKLKDSSLSIISILFALIDFFLGWTVFIALVVGIIDLAVDNKNYRHLGSWVAIVYAIARIVHMIFVIYYK